MSEQKYVHAPDGHYPYHLRAIDGGDPALCAKRRYPDVSPLPATWGQCSPEQLAALKAASVLPTEPPVLAAGERLAEGDPEFAAGEWRQTWVVTPAPVQGVPEEVDSLAFELTLHNLGIHAAVLAYVDTLPAVEQIYWHRRPTMRRDSAMIEAGRIALGLTTEQVDALFVAASAQQT